MPVTRRNAVPMLPCFKKIIRVQIYGIESTKQFHTVRQRHNHKGIVTSGVSAMKDEVWEETCQVIHSCTTPILGEIGPKDFHFINLAGKQASVLSCKEGFEWKGRAVKKLAGSGAVYI